MNPNNQFTEGKIFGPLIKFAIPVFFALCLQSLYGAVDLLVVGRFVDAKDVAAAVSAVSNGSQIMHMRYYWKQYLLFYSACISIDSDYVVFCRFFCGTFTCTERSV